MVPKSSKTNRSSLAREIEVNQRMSFCNHIVFIACNACHRPLTHHRDTSRARKRTRGTSFLHHSSMDWRRRKGDSRQPSTSTLPLSKTKTKQRIDNVTISPSHLSQQLDAELFIVSHKRHPNRITESRHTTAS